MDYLTRTYSNKNLGIYYIITVTFISICLWLIFRFVHAFPSSVLYDSQIATTINSVDYYVALTQGISSSLIVLFALFSDNIIWRKISLLSVFRMQGSEYNFLMLAFLLTISLCSFFFVIPYRSYELLFIFDNLRILWIITFTFCYLWTYVGGIWKSPKVMSTILLAGFAQLLRMSAMFFSNPKLINLIGFVFLLLSLSIFLCYSIIWCKSLWNIKYEEYTFEMYSCNIYLIFFWVSAFIILLFYLKDGIEIWQNILPYKRMIYLYVNMVYIVGVALTQSRGARVNKDISQVTL
jgi:hypothetical protein